jgi:hypothetical protein
MAEKYGNEVEGRSKVVMSDVFDTVEWIKPALMRIFYGGNQVVNFEPEGKEDTEGAKLLEQKVNFDFQKGLNGFLLLYDWFDDALKFKLGVVKYWWEKRTEFRQRRFKAPLSSEELLTLFDDKNFYPDKIESVNGPEDATVGPFNVKGRMGREISKPMCEVIPPEEFICDIRAVDFKKEDFVAHWKRKHVSEIVKDYAVSKTELESEASYMGGADYGTLYWNRFKDLGGIGFMRDETDKDYYYIYECYINDYSSGEKQSKKVVICGTKKLAEEDNSYGHPNFCTLSPIRVAHRAIGRSVAELVEDLQELHTALRRYILDNIYYQNNGREIVNPFRINMDDYINNQFPGGRTRTSQDISPADCVHQLDIRPLAPWVLTMIEQVEELKENRTGITRYNQGTDADSLNKTAHGISQIMTASMQRVDLIARIFAETGVKDLFTAFAQMNIDYGEDEVNFRLNDEWQTVRREDIDVRFDVNANAGIGTGTREMTVQQMLQMLQVCLNQALTSAGVFTPENAYNVLKVIFENLGRKDVDSFVTDPAMAQQQQQEAAMMQQQMMGGMNVPGAQGAGPAGPEGQGGVVGGGSPNPGQLPGEGILPGNGAAAIQ